MYYLVDSKNYVVGQIESLEGEPPLGYREVELESVSAVGRYLDDKDEILPLKPTPEAPLSMPIEQVRFWNTPEFKQARIKANKNPVLAVSLMVAIASEIQGDQATLKGSIKSITDILRASP